MRAELRAEIQGTAAEMRAELRAEIQGTAAETRAELRAEIQGTAAETRAELRAEIQGTAAELRRHFGVLAEDLRSDIRAVAEGTLGNASAIHHLEVEMNRRFVSAEVVQRVAFDDFREQLGDVRRDLAELRSGR
jgi:F0F1-type ATP synthase membrane subunit b/b'